MSSEARVQTNRLLAKAFDLNDFLDPTRLAHDELQYYNDITRALDKTIDKYVEWLDTEEARELFHEGVKAKKEYFDAIDKDLDDIIQDTSLSADGIIEKIYQKGLNYGYKDINRLPVFNDACKYGLKATQEYNFDLISNVSDDLRESIKHHIFRGVGEGQSVQQVAKALVDSGLKPLEGKTLSAYQRASLIARTEIARSMTTGRLQAYANYGVKKVKILTAGDEHVCPICLKAAHKFNGEMSIENVSGDKLYTLEEASDLVPFHPACRCSVMAYIEHYQLPKETLNDPDVICCAPLNNRFQYNLFNYDDDAYHEFNKISEEGYISFRDDDNYLHQFRVKCKKNSKVKFHGELDDNEKFYEYQIFNDGEKKPFLTIYRSHDHQGLSVSQVLKIHQSLPNKLTKNCKQIRLSNQELPEKGGYVHPKFPTEINILANVEQEDMDYVVIHEMAHVFDITNGVLSNSEEYIKAYYKDLERSMELLDNKDKWYFLHHISEYARDITKGALEGKKHKDTPYIEDFAECVYYLFHDQSFLHGMCPAKEEYLCNIFNKLIYEPVKV